VWDDTWREMKAKKGRPDFKEREKGGCTAEKRSFREATGCLSGRRVDSARKKWGAQWPEELNHWTDVEEWEGSLGKKLLSKKKARGKNTGKNRGNAFLGFLDFREKGGNKGLRKQVVC